MQAQLGHATTSITLDTYGHPFPSETEALADRLEMVRDAAIARVGADPARTHGQRPEGNRRWMTGCVAEAEGFEPSRELPPYTLSRRVPSTARPSLRGAVYARGAGAFRGGGEAQNDACPDCAGVAGGVGKERVP